MLCSFCFWRIQSKDEVNAKHSKQKINNEIKAQFTVELFVLAKVQNKQPVSLSFARCPLLQMPTTAIVFWWNNSQWIEIILVFLLFSSIKQNCSGSRHPRIVTHKNLIWIIVARSQSTTCRIHQTNRSLSLSLNLLSLTLPSTCLRNVQSSNKIFICSSADICLKKKQSNKRKFIPRKHETLKQWKMGCKHTRNKNKKNNKS